MVRCADAFVRSRSLGRRTRPREPGRADDRQKARKGYYSAYVRTIGERLMNARKQAETQYDRTADGPSAALVLRDKELEVRDTTTRHPGPVVPGGGNRSSFSSQRAVQQARTDAQQARLDPARRSGQSPCRGVVNDTRRVYDAENTLLFMLDNGGTVQFLGSSLTLPVERRFGDLEGASLSARGPAKTVGSPADSRTAGARAQGPHEGPLVRDTIAIPDGIGERGWAMREVVVLHEYAHHVAWHEHAATGHGRDFQEVYLGLLENAVAPEAALIVRVGFGDGSRSVWRPAVKVHRRGPGGPRVVPGIIEGGHCASICSVCCCCSRSWSAHRRVFVRNRG